MYPCSKSFGTASQTKKPMWHLAETFSAKEKIGSLGICSAFFLFHWISATVNEKQQLNPQNVNAPDLRVTRSALCFNAGDWRRTWAWAERDSVLAAHKVKGHLIPHMESFSVEAAWRSETRGPVFSLVFSSPGKPHKPSGLRPIISSMFSFSSHPCLVTLILPPVCVFSFYLQYCFISIDLKCFFLYLRDLPQLCVTDLSLNCQNTVLAALMWC